MRLLTEDVWVQEDAIKLGPVELKLRMTVVRLGNGELWVHSPTAISDSLRQEVDQLGKVGVLVAASNGHNLFLLDWIAAYPDARVYCSAGVPKKLPALTEFSVLANSAGCPWPGDFQMQKLEGAPFFDESLFLHPASGSLIVTDFVQNYRNQTYTGLANVMSKLVLQPIGFKDICLAPPLRFKFMIKDRPAFVAGVEKVLSWQFERIIVTHGDIIEENAQATLARLCERFS
jgi:hypothetical protein